MLLFAVAVTVDESGRETVPTFTLSVGWESGRVNVCLKLSV